MNTLTDRVEIFAIVGHNFLRKCIVLEVCLSSVCLYADVSVNKYNLNASKAFNLLKVINSVVRCNDLINMQYNP